MMPQLAAGDVLGRYELLLPIAKGGMAQVWAARLRGSRGFQKLVAIKTILANAIDNTRLERMFLEEAQLASRVHHANVAATLELGEHEGVLYQVMEWVDGEPIGYLLTRALERGGMPLPIAVNLLAQVCRGLHAAHELCDEDGTPLGVVHRDVSPQNVLVSVNGVVKVVDFGIAKVTGRVSNMTQEGEVKGKFGYMSPEQVQGQPLDRRSDIFALGILAYSLTTGRHPFRGDNPASTVRNIVREQPPKRPREVVADYPYALEQVVLKALQKSPAQRFTTCDDLLTALEAAVPQAFEANLQLAGYARELMGERSAERNTAIRRAQELFDHKRGENVPSSIGTLRAIALDSTADATPSPSRIESLMIETTPSAPFARPAGRSPLVVGLGVFATCAALFGVREAFRSGGDDHVAASASPALGAPNAAAVGASGVPVLASSSAMSPVPSASPPAPESSAETPRTARSRATGKAAAARPAVVAPRPAVAVPPTTPAPASVAPSSATKSSAPSSAWDRDAFGGRH